MKVLTTKEEVNFIHKAFAHYYREASSKIVPPKDFEKREFGFSLFREGLMIRHIGFSEEGELKRFLMENVPKDAYYSSAYYKDPREEMDKKGWLGADLIFDIDADHIPTPCKKEHDFWSCRDCGLTQTGEAPTKCPNCEGERIVANSWPCEVCLESAKREVLKLIEILMDDFGFSTQELKIYYSGHRGYHVHIESEQITLLSSEERKEVVDYLQATGIELRYHGLSGVRSLSMKGPDLSDSGWRGRIARSLYDFMLKKNLEEELLKLGLRKRAVSSIIEKREKILDRWKGKGPWGLIGGVGLRTWSRIVEGAIKSQAVNVDSVVTTDTHRLIRMGGTLHSKTGFIKKQIPIHNLEEFNPFNDAVVFDEEEIKVYIPKAPKFILKNQVFGPFKDCKAELPKAAAILLICKGMARLEQA